MRLNHHYHSFNRYLSVFTMPLLEDIEKLTKPVFALPDLEDDDVDGTASSTVFRNKHAGSDGILKPKRKVIDLCLDDSSKYGGTKVSRDDIFDHSDFVGLADRVTSGKNDSNEESVDKDVRNRVLNEHVSKRNQKDERNSVTDDDEFDDQIGLDSGVDNSSSDLDSTDDEDDERDSQQRLREKSTSMSGFMSNVDQDKQHRKAVSVYEQTRIWEQLLYIKIKVHSALRAFNQLPRGQLANDFVREADENVVSSLMHARRNAVELVSTLLEAEDRLLHLFSLTKSINEVEDPIDSNNEEIESSENEGEEFYSNNSDESDDGRVTGEQREEGCVTNTLKASCINLKSLCRRLREKEQQFERFRNSTLTKWDERTMFIVSGRSKNANNDFSAFEKNNIISRIEKICSDKDRLLKRSRTKKSDIERIGGIAEAEEDDEIYDDDDFYQTLLKELIDKKTNDTRDPIAMTRHYIEMQKLRSKRVTKKIVDHRVSKDRKIKYLPIAKLVNFHPAMPEMVEWSNESRNELFKSIFT